MQGLILEGTTEDSVRLSDSVELVNDLQPRECRVEIHAAGVCGSDLSCVLGKYYMPTPLVPGHEVAGIIESVGPGVVQPMVGDRVCLHYLVTCGDCYHCRRGNEQFCVQGRMLGKDIDGGYAEYLVVPARNAVPLPEDIAFVAGAVLMCSSATSFHALRKARLAPGERVAVFGAGGLGMSAIQLARAFGALEVYAVDISADKLSLAAEYGAIPVDAARGDPIVQLQDLTSGTGVDVALELIGLAQTMEQAVQSLGVFGRAVLAGISAEPFAIDSYRVLLGREAEVIGCSDHLLWELPLLVEFVRQGKLDLSRVVARTIPLDVNLINEAMDALEEFGGEVRTVITP